MSRSLGLKPKNPLAGSVSSRFALGQAAGICIVRSNLFWRNDEPWSSNAVTADGGAW